MRLLGALLRIAFLWWWEKNVEYRLEYYSDGKIDATKAIQHQLDKSAYVTGQPVYVETGVWNVKQFVIPPGVTMRGPYGGWKG